MRCTLWNTFDLIKTDHFYTITACIMENNQGPCITDTAETNYVAEQFACKKIENYYDITTDSINGRLYSSFTAITSNDDDSEKCCSKG